MRLYASLPLMLFVLINLCGTALATESPEALLKSYGDFMGEWEGSYKNVYSTVDLPGESDNAIEVKMIFKGNQLLFDIKPHGSEWHGISRNMSFTTNELMVEIKALNNGGGWIETFNIVISKINKNNANLYLMRTVNNWAIELEDKIKVYSEIGIGQVRRID